MQKLSMITGVLLVLLSIFLPTDHGGIINLGLLQMQMMVFQAGLASLIVAAMLSVGERLAVEDYADEEEEERA